MMTVYLICFVVGLVMSVLAAFSGLGHLHMGHLHFGHAHARVPGHGHGVGDVSAVNGFTLPAFLCWFGGAGYLMMRYGVAGGLLTIVAACFAGLIGAGILYVALFKVLMPRERVLTEEETRMDGVVGRVSDEIRADGGTGEILFSQADARRSAAARSDTGSAIARGTEVVVLRYAKGIAYVSPLEELMKDARK